MKASPGIARTRCRYSVERRKRSPEIAVDVMKQVCPVLSHRHAVLLAITLCGSMSAVASGAGDIEALRQQVLDLQPRVAALEARLGGGCGRPGAWWLALGGQLESAGRWHGGRPGRGDSWRAGQPQTRQQVRVLELGDSKMSLYMGRLKKWEIPSGIEGE